MSDVQLYLFEVGKNRPEAQNIATQSAAKLESKQLKLIDLITSLEPYINNKENASLRANAVGYLADVLENVPPRVLSGQERRLLCDFILGRLEGDVEGINGSVRALVALEHRGKWDLETAHRVMRTFLQYANPLKQFKLQTDRYAIIQLIDLLMGKYRAAMKQLHESDPEFMSSFISYFEGEKDPRNLMIIFSILQVPMAEWDIHANSQDLLEAVFNYFPITFKPPPDDPYGITAQDLKDRLRDCIAANSEFAPHSFPALLDKLDSTSVNTKRDVLQTIQACVAGYGANTVNLYSITLWDALKFEILNVQEKDLAEESLKALSLIAAKFAKSEGPLNAYLRPIIKECNEHLEDAPTKQSQAAGRILHAVATSGAGVAEKIAKGVLPTLFTLYQASESISKRRGLLEVFNEIIKAYVELCSAQGDINIGALQDPETDALGILLRALTHAPKSEVSFRLTALDGISKLLAIRGLLSEIQTEQAIEAVTNIILHERIHGHGDIRSEAIITLRTIAHTSPDTTRSRALPAFMAELPDSPTDVSACSPVLEALAQLSSEQQIFDTVVLRLRNKLNAARAQGAPKEYQLALLLAILYSFTHGSPRPDEDGVIRRSYFTDFAEPLMSTLEDIGGMGSDDKSLEVVGRICNITLRPQGVHFQSTVYSKNQELMNPGHASPSQSLDRTKRLAPFLLYYYSALRLEVVDPADIIALLKSFADIALVDMSEPAEASVILRHISLLVNKSINPKAMQSTLESARIEVESLLSAGANTSSTNIAFSVVKALLVQGKCGALTSKYLQLLLQRLPSSKKAFARRFAGLLAPDDILTKENHCLISGLYKQKTFNQVVPSIIEAVRKAETTAKPNYLIALSGVLRWLPYSMIESSLSSLIPPLLQAMDLTEPADQEVKASTLTVFESVLMHDPDVVSEHAASLITRLLNCTAGPAANSAKVRAKSLQCLALVPRQLKQETVVPYRRQVVKRLMACLDDPKRNVRAEAVKCRTAWLGLDEGEDQDE